MKLLLRYLLILLLVFGAVHNVEAQKKRKGKSKKERSKKKGKKKRKSKKKKGKKSSSKGGKLSKKDKKTWKKKLKSLTPGKYKKLMTEYYALKDRVASAEEEVATCQSSISEKEELIGRYQKEVTKLRKAAPGQKATKVDSSSTTSSENVSGVTYRIQIGAYEKINLSQYAGQKNFGVEQAASLQKFTIGLFQNYREADTLKKYLQQMGVKDAWIVAYKDGNRVDVKEVLNQAAGGAPK